MCLKSLSKIAGTAVIARHQEFTADLRGSRRIGELDPELCEGESESKGDKSEHLVMNVRLRMR
jgi:hypothetical protein